MKDLYEDRIFDVPVQHIPLVMKEYFQSRVYPDMETKIHNPEFTVDRLMSEMAHRITMQFRMPCEELQDHVLIVDYPSTDWDGVKMWAKNKWPRLFSRLTYNMEKVYLDEFILYDKIGASIPHTSHVHQFAVTQLTLQEK